MQTATRLLITACATGVLCAGAFAWGVLATERRVFPHRQLQAAARALGWIREEPVQVRSPSPPLAALVALPYVDGTVDPDREASGVLVHAPGKAFPGYNLYVSKRRGSAFLLDMEGETVHRWQLAGPLREAHAEVTAAGELLVLTLRPDSGGGSSGASRLVKLDHGSRQLWSYEEPVHHDFSLAEGGEVYVCVSRRQTVPRVHPEAEVLVDSIVRLAADGTPLEEVSVLEMLERSPYAFLLPALAHLDGSWPGPLDLTHLNHVEFLGGNAGPAGGIFTRGNLLISLRNLSAIAAVDWQRREILWLWGPGNLTFQHHPTLLTGGNVLLFDNGLERSRVLELDPVTSRIVWSYGPLDGFFSRTRGSQQRLGNGNTLITESDTGYAFEVTAGGEEVWRFANPDVRADGTREAMWKITRLATEELRFLHPRGEPPAGGQGGTE